MKTLAQKTYTLLSQVPKGRVTTYKALAHRLHTKAYRAIGQIMRNNPYAPTIPCHRVVRSDGAIGGYMGKTAGNEIQKKIALLDSESVAIKQGRILDFQKMLYTFE